MVYCEKCGKPILETAKFCKYCGSLQEPEEELHGNSNPEGESESYDVERPNMNFARSRNEEDDLSAASDRIFELHDSGQLARAITMAEELAEKYPDEDRAWVLVGIMNAEWGDLNRAMYGYDKAIRINPGHGGALGEMGMCLFQNEQYREAVEYFDRSLKIQETENYMYTAVAAVANISGTDAALQKCNEYLKTAEKREMLENKLGQIYTAKAFDCFIHVDENQSYLVSKESVTAARSYLTQALRLMTREDICSGDIQDAKRMLDACNISEERIFQGYLCRKAVTLTIIGAILMAAAPAVGIFILGYGIIGIVACRIPQWRVNRILMYNERRPTLFKAIMDLIR